MKISSDTFSNRLISTHSDNIRDERRNRYYNRFTDMARLGRYRTHEFVNDGDALTVKSYKFNHYHRNMSKFLKKTSAEDLSSQDFVRKGLPLPITKDCQFLGVVNGQKRRS